MAVLKRKTFIVHIKDQRPWLMAKHQPYIIAKNIPINVILACNSVLKHNNSWQDPEAIFHPLYLHLFNENVVDLISLEFFNQQWQEFLKFIKSISNILTIIDYK